MALDQYALCTVQNLVDFGGESINEANDRSTLESLINSVSASIETYCSRKFLTREYTEYHDGTGEPYIFPYNSPITTVSGIWIDASWVWDGDAIDSTSYRIVNDNHIAFNNFIPYVGEQNIKITYTAGYATVPYDVQQVVIEEALRRYKNKNNIGKSAIVSSDMGQITLMTDDILPVNKTILDAYRKRYTV